MNAGRKSRERKAAGEDRVKADLPEAVLSYYDDNRTHYFMPSTVSL
jgi:hypothetical protein